jgi:hypothetical protein
MHVCCCAGAERMGSASATPVGPARTAVCRLRRPRVDADSTVMAVRGRATCSRAARAMAGVCMRCVYVLVCVHAHLPSPFFLCAATPFRTRHQMLTHHVVASMQHLL